MCKGLLGKKMGMTGLFSADGRYIPVTVVHIDQCVVTQIKTVAKDGYNALQIGSGEKKESRVNKPLKGHMKKNGDHCFALLREFSVDNPDKYKPGQTINIDMFKVGECVDVTGISKGRGFSGVIKRHGFHGGPKTHGNKSHRIPGSVGCSAWPAKIIKGKKMPGHYGNEQNTIKNLEIIDIRTEENLLMIKGALPGCKSGVLEIKKLKF